MRNWEPKPLWYGVGRKMYIDALRQSDWEPKPLWYGVGRKMYIDALRQSDGFCNRSNTRQKARRCASSALRSRAGDGGEGWSRQM